jgi:hypothetical protein
MEETKMWLQNFGYNLITEDYLRGRNPGLNLKNFTWFGDLASFYCYD